MWSLGFKAKVIGVREGDYVPYSHSLVGTTESLAGILQIRPV